MTRDEVIRMATEAGLLEPGYQHGDTVLSELERFATLVAAAERRRFALECIDIVAFHGGSVEIEATIRVRGAA